MSFKITGDRFLVHPQVLIVFDRRRTSDWAQTEEDRQEGRTPFIIYIQGNSQEELQGVRAKVKPCLRPQKTLIRESDKNLGFPFELKLTGVGFKSYKAWLANFME